MSMQFDQFTFYQAPFDRKYSATRMNSAGNKRAGLKTASPIYVLSVLSHHEDSKGRMLKQLQQLDIDVKYLSCLPVYYVAKQTDDLMRNTYSVKYVGLNQNYMGIISRRINPLSDQSFMLVDPAQTSYAINKYFYPKPLRVGKKVHNEQKIDVYNLESEIRKQFDMNDNLQVNHTSSQGLKGQSAIRMINYKCFKYTEMRKKNHSQNKYPEISCQSKAICLQQKTPNKLL